MSQSCCRPSELPHRRVGSSPQDEEDDGDYVEEEEEDEEEEEEDGGLSLVGFKRDKKGETAVL